MGELSGLASFMVVVGGAADCLLPDGGLEREDDPSFFDELILSDASVRNRNNWKYVKTNC